MLYKLSMPRSRTRKQRIAVFVERTKWAQIKSKAALQGKTLEQIFEELLTNFINE